MDPGDSWSSDTGFELVGRRLVRRPREPPRGARGAGRAEDRRPDAGGEGVTLDYETFADYFDGFMRAFPPGVLGRFVLHRPVVFEVPSSPLPFWVLDFSRRAVYRLSAPPPDTASIVTVNEGGARRRDREAPRARGARVDAHPRPPPARWRRRRPHVLGTRGAVGARVRPVAVVCSDRASRRWRGDVVPSGSSGRRVREAVGSRCSTASPADPAPTTASTSRRRVAAHGRPQVVLPHARDPRVRRRARHAARRGAAGADRRDRRAADGDHADLARAGRVHDADHACARRAAGGRGRHVHRATRRSPSRAACPTTATSSAAT